MTISNKETEMNERFKELKRGVIKRMEDIERSLFWQGTLSRQELAIKLRMSNPQTTTIIKIPRI